MATRSREQFSEVADIGQIPPVVDPARRARCRDSLLEFLTTYFPASTGKHPFSQDHLDFIDRLQRTILQGGREIDCVYRGFAKTTIGELATLWAILYGHKKFGVILGADREAAENNLESLKAELESNDLLFEDFPEVCHAVRSLEGRAQRCHTQTHSGSLTGIGWTAKEIVFPTVVVDGQASASAGACIRTKGLLSCNRGMTHKDPSTGEQRRPDWVFVDDPQTDQSAQSPAQCQKRLDKLYKTVLRLAGNMAALSLFIAATVIVLGDMAHQLLDRELHPSFSGHRVAMVSAFAKAHDTHWLGEYARIRNDYERGDPDDRERARKAATAYYKKHRKAMDAGAVVSWDYCYSPEMGELSAIQHAYNILIDDGEEVFASECQNEPKDRPGDVEQLPAADLARKQHGTPRGALPIEASRVTAFVDVHGNALYWVVMGWSDEFGGYVVDFGIYPEQAEDYVELKKIRRTMRKRHKGTDEEGAIYASLSELITGETGLMQREWRRPDGGVAQIEMVLIDSGWNSALVKRWVRAAGRPSIRASKGHGLGAKQKPMSEWTLAKGCRRGREWIETRPAKDPVKLVNYNANYWKTQTQNGLAQPIGNRSAISFPKASPRSLALLADHLLAEKGIRVSTPTSSAIEWTCPPGVDNHFGDGVVGCAVGASMLGCMRPGDEVVRRGRKRRGPRVKVFK